jgi:hypothetical protein
MKLSEVMLAEQHESEVPALELLALILKLICFGTFLVFVAFQIPGHQVKDSMHMFQFVRSLYVTLDKKVIFVCFVTQSEVGKPSIIFLC